MAVATGTALLAAAAIGVASTAYQTDVQKQLSDQDRSRREKAAAAAKSEADRIARDTRPDEQEAEAIAFGSTDKDKEFDSAGNFLVPKTSSLGGGVAGRSGLGFAV